MAQIPDYVALRLIRATHATGRIDVTVREPGNAIGRSGASLLALRTMHCVDPISARLSGQGIGRNFGAHYAPADTQRL